MCVTASMEVRPGNSLDERDQPLWMGAIHPAMLVSRTDRPILHGASNSIHNFFIRFLKGLL